MRRKPALPLACGTNPYLKQNNIDNVAAADIFMSFLMRATRRESFSPLPGPEQSVIVNCTKSPRLLGEAKPGLFLPSRDFAIAPSRGGIEFPGHRGLRSQEIPSLGPYKAPEIRPRQHRESPPAALG